MCMLMENKIKELRKGPTLKKSNYKLTLNVSFRFWLRVSRGCLLTELNALNKRIGLNIQVIPIKNPE